MKTSRSFGLQCRPSYVPHLGLAPLGPGNPPVTHDFNPVDLIFGELSVSEHAGNHRTKRLQKGSTEEYLRALSGAGGDHYPGGGAASGGRSLDDVAHWLDREQKAGNHAVGAVPNPGGLPDASRLRVWRAWTKRDLTAQA